jgi:ubiquitin carboxyl-terminal hydrolase L5
MNRPEIDLGKELQEFKSFAQGLDAETRGVLIGNSPTIQKAHNSFRRPEPFIFEQKGATEDDDVYHFIGYVPVNGCLYELDGLKQGPILLGDCTLENWLQKAKPAIQERMNRYSAAEIRFALLAVCKNRKEVYEAKISKMRERIAQLQAKYQKASEGKAGDAMDVSDDALPSSPAELMASLSAAGAEEKELENSLKAEEAKFKKWEVENVRRKHNYVPFVFNLLKVLAEKGKLPEIVEKAQQSAATRQSARDAAKKKEAEKGKGKPASAASSSSSSSGSSGDKPK